MEKFQSSTTGSQVYYKNKFNNSILRSENNDPGKWNVELEKIRKLIKSTGTEISDEKNIVANENAS